MNQAITKWAGWFTLGAILLQGTWSRQLCGEERAPLKTKGLIVSLDEVQLPARQPGVVELLRLRPGQLVTKDQHVVSIDSTNADLRLVHAKAELDIAKSEASNELKALQIEKAAELAQKELESQQALFNKDATSFLDLEKAKLNMEQAVLEAQSLRKELEDKQLVVRAKEADLELASMEVQERKINAPFDGIVARINRRQGEWAQQGEPILHLIRMDKLRVQVFIDPDEVSPLSLLGCTSTVVAHIGNGEIETFECEPVEDLAAEVESDGHYMLWVNVLNKQVKTSSGSVHWLLRPGMEVDLSIIDSP
jgi:multidrug resistance efflux pump